MAVVRRIGLFIAAAALAAAAFAPAASAQHRRGPVVTHLAEFGNDDFVTGSTIGPDGALYVTDGNAGEVLRIDRRDGAVSTFATGLPPKAFQGQDIGGPVDVAFIGRTAYVLVTLVSGAIFGEPFGDPEAKNGLYRIERDGTHTLVADIGQWSIDNPPQPAFFVDTGVQYAMEPYKGGFLVTDGHHNRMLQVTRDGEVTEFNAFGNIVPTGLAVSGNTVYMAEAGPVPHDPEDGKVVSFGPKSLSPREIASGAPLLVDVEFGRGRSLYALSQGDFSGGDAGAPALPNTGSLVKVNRNGTFTVIAEGLDRPTSVDFIGNTAFVVTLGGEIWRLDNVSGRPYGVSR